jgi:hypothetical protein
VEVGGEDAGGLEGHFVSGTFRGFGEGRISGVQVRFGGKNLDSL